MLFSMSCSLAGHKSNLIDLLADRGDFKTLLVALETTGLDKKIREEKGITFFAPTDEAFSNISDEVLSDLLNDERKLKSVLLYHLSNSKLKADKLVTLNGIKTRANKYIVLRKVEDDLFLNDSKLVEKNLAAKNGIVHVIDKPLIPNKNTPANEIETVPYVDIKKYMGLWYEVYRFPNEFETGCGNVTAKYTLKKRGRVRVINTCVKENGDVNEGKGTAKVTNTETNASLKVSFVPILQYWLLFAGDYNIIGLGENYEYAVVGSKDRNYLWFLARKPELDDATVAYLKSIAISQGYDVKKLIKTPDFK